MTARAAIVACREDLAGSAFDTVYIHSMRSGRRIDGTERDDAAANANPPLKGRGVVWAIQHRFSRQLSEAYDDGWGTLDQQASEERLPPATQIIEERAKSILSSNDSPDISFDLSINPYRGCEHVIYGKTMCD